MTRPAPKAKVESKPATPTPEAAKGSETPIVDEEQTLDDVEMATVEELPADDNAKPMEVDDID